MSWAQIVHAVLKVKSKEAGQKTLPNPAVARCSFSVGDVLGALARQPTSERRVKLELNGDKFAATILW